LAAFDPVEERKRDREKAAAIRSKFIVSERERERERESGERAAGGRARGRERATDGRTIIGINDGGNGTRISLRNEDTTTQETPNFTVDITSEK
jgi:hypothetical protein